MPLAGFEPTISEGERTQTYALDRAAPGASPSEVITGINIVHVSICKGYGVSLVGRK